MFRWVPSRDVGALYQQPARRRPRRCARRRHGRRRDELPGRRVVQARGDAVARPRPAARRSPARAARIWSPRSPGLDIKISGCPNGCGQHHIAGIGFQGSLRKVGGRPVPQYFVMVGGGIADGITTFGRHAAKIPARRCDEALERLIGLYQRSAGGRTRRRLPSSAASTRGGQGARSPTSTRSIRRHATLDGLHRSGRGPRVPARSQGRGVQRVTSIAHPRDRPSSVLDLIGRTPLLRLGRLCRVDRRRDLRQGGVPEPWRIGEGPRRGRDHRATASGPAGCIRA